MTSPFGPLVLIANPRAGNGRVGSALPAIERALTERDLAYRVVTTTHPGHATQAAREALRQGERFLVAVGGDGTVHEVVNGMLEDGDRPVAADAVLGVIAAGSGCDFVRSFGLPGDAVQAAGRLAGDAVRVIDLGKVATPQFTGYFPNIAEAGLGGTVVARAATLPRRFGSARYAAAFWLALPRFRPTRLRVVADGAEYEWLAHNVVVANCRFYGGGMQIAPNAACDDGALDVLVMTGRKSAAFTSMAKIYRGTHLPHPGIVELRVATVTVDADEPQQVEADGELLGTTPVTFGIVPGPIKLKV